MDDEKKEYQQGGDAIGKLIVSQLVKLKKELDKLEAECDPWIASACAASGLANGVDPLPIPAISVTADITIMIGLAAKFSDLYAKRVKWEKITQDIHDGIKGLLVGVAEDEIKKKATKMLEKNGIQAFMEKSGKKIAKKAGELCSRSYILNYFAKSAVKTTAKNQLKWIPLLGQMAVGAQAAYFMSYSARDVRKLYSDLYYEEIRSAIYASAGRKVPTFKFKIDKQGVISGTKVWILEAIDNDSGTTVVKIEKDYGMSGNYKKAVDFYTAVTGKGYVFTSKQTDDIAKQMYIDNEFYKPYQKI